MPSTTKFASLIPNLLHLRIVLNHNSVFEESSGSGVSAIAIQAVLSVASGATGVDANVELSVGAAQTGWQVDAVDITERDKSYV